MRKHIAEVFSAEKRLELEMLRVRVQEQRSEIERAYASVCARLDALRVRRQTARAEAAASKALIAAREWMLPLNAAGIAREESLDEAREALFSLRCRSQALSELQT